MSEEFGEFLDRDREPQSQKKRKEKNNKRGDYNDSTIAIIVVTVHHCIEELTHDFMINLSTFYKESFFPCFPVYQTKVVTNKNQSQEPIYSFQDIYNYQ